MSARGTATQRLASFAVSLRPEDLPFDVIDNARWRLVDMLGVIVAGTRLESAGPILRVANRMGGVEESSTLVFGSRLPAPLAGFVNGAIGHGPDYDDTHSGAAVHISNLVVPAALATAEATGANGQQLLGAMVAGAEVGLTVAAAAPSHAFHRRGFHATSATGPFATAAVGSCLLGLDHEAMTNALGMAASQSAGLLQGLVDGSWVKRLQPGWAVQAGLTAAALAAEGFTGPAEALEGRFGFYNAFLHGEQDIQIEAMLDRLGQRWLYPETVYKPYPNGAWNHASMDGLVQIMTEHRLSHEQIAAVECSVPPDCIPIVCEPRLAKLNPTSGYHMKFSLPYSIAILAVLGHAEVDDYSEEVRQNPLVRGFAERVTCVADPSLTSDGFPARVRVSAHGGHFECAVAAQRGGPLNPMGSDGLRAKFRANVRPSLGDDGTERLLAEAEAIWAAEGISRLVRLTQPASSGQSLSS